MCEPPGLAGAVAERRGAALRQAVSDRTLGDNLSSLLFIARESTALGGYFE
jgi:hypothetical protein